MALKDLLVLVGSGMEAAGVYASGLARASGASLTAAVAVVEPSFPSYVMTELPEDFLTRIQEEAEAEASRALSGFSEAAQRLGISVETLRFQTPPGRAGSELSRLARCFDATVLPQPDPNGVDTTDTIEAMLFGSGRPLIIVPYIQKRSEIGTVLIAWDGGVPAARAVADSLPILALARRAQVVVIGDSAGASPHLSGDAMVRHLVRHGIQAEAKRIPGGGIDPANMLLSHAADIDADMIVMGGYSHSRFREMMLGGTTREILRSMTVPVVMSH